MRNGLAKYLVKRAFLGLVTLFAILLASYMLMRLAPGDPTRSSMLESSGEKGISEEKSEFGVNRSLREKLHLDKPVHVGFALWLERIALHGDFGESASVDRGRPAAELILERLPVTLRLNILAILVTYLLAIPLGIFSAVRPDTKADNFLTVFLFFLFSLPAVWTALMLQATLCRGGLLPIFPLKGISYASPEGVSTWTAVWRTSLHYVLPVACLSYANFAGLARFTRSGMLDVIHSDYIRTARAKGLPESTVIFKHAFRNALIVMITLFAGILPGLVGGSILVEYVFNIPGMGLLSMTALSSRDIPLVMALFTFGGVLTLAGILISDLLYVAADPRIDFNSKI